MDMCRFRQSRRATANLLDSFEKTLADAMTLDPRPPKPDLLGGEAMSEKANSNSVSTALPSGVGAFGWNFQSKQKPIPARPMEPGTEWDWSALGDEPQSGTRSAETANLLDGDDAAVAKHHPASSSVTLQPVSAVAASRSAGSRPLPRSRTSTRTTSVPVVEEETEEWAVW
jgi:hypothetical protein